MKKLLMTITLALAAAIAIPTATVAQTTTKQTNECCKEKKDCAKAAGKQCEGKACAKAAGKQCEGKACAKADGKQCEGKACAKADGKQCEGKACAKADGKQCEGKACAKADGKQCAKDKGHGCCKAGKKGPKDFKMGKGKRTAGDRKEMGMKRGGENPLMKGITLTAEQQNKMNELRQKNAAEQKKAKAEMKAKSKEEMQKLRADFDKEVEKILNKEQLKQYKANKAEMEANRAAKANKKS